MIKKILFFVLTIVVITTKLNAQGGSTFINRVYQDESGSPTFNPILNPLGLQWSKSIICANGDLMTVGHTHAGTAGEDIYVIRHDPDGGVVFEQNYDVASANYNDYGTDIYETTNNDFIICGMTDNGTTNNYDVAVLRINSGGTLLTSNTRNGPSSKNDFAVSIIEDGSGYIFVGANTENTFFDYWLIKWDSGLTFNSENFYDYTGLNDVAIGMEVDAGGSEVQLIGASASGTNSCDYAIARFDGTTLSYLSDGRSSLPGVALDKALAFVRDVGNNTYITGQAWNGSNYDIKTVKILANMTVAWTATMDVNSYDDAGATIALDPTNGHVIVGGYATRSGNIKDMICIRYNASTGATVAIKNQSAENNTGDAFIKKVCTKTNGDVYFVAGEKGKSGNKQVAVGKISVGGNLCWQRKIQGTGGVDILPSDIQTSANVIDVISVVDSILDSYLTTEFSEFEADSAKTFIAGLPAYQKRDLIVSFMPTAINKSAIDNQVGTKISEYGDLSDFLTHSADSILKVAFNGICRDCDIKAIKIFDCLKTTDTVAVSRLGQKVPVPSFWSTLLLQFPTSITLQQAGNVLKTLDFVSYSHPDFFLKPLSTPPPDDSLYAVQSALYNTFSFSHINVEDAWNVVTSCGSTRVKGGVFDTGVEWTHKDFGFTGSQSSGKVQGWHFDPNSSFPSGGVDIRDPNYVYTQDVYGHGTAVAGIIGAERNNTIGIAGVAGGDGANNNPGVKLYSLNTGGPGVAIHWALKALSETCFDDTSAATPYRYGLNFSNHSYRITYNTIYPDSFASLREQVHFANRMQVTFIAARGDDSTNSAIYPANFDSSWVISVGGLGVTPTKWPGSSYGSHMDLIAPAATSMIRSTWNNLSYAYLNATSAAATYASGVVGLLQSYMNDSTGLNPYINLAPEDCEYILQHSATDLSPLGYDSLTGYGMLNAGGALHMVEKPHRVLYHYGTNYRFPYSISKNAYSANDTIILTEKYTTPVSQIVYNPGKYVVNTFSITANISQVSTYPTDSLLRYWPRSSSSYVYDLFNAQKKIDMHEKVKINSISGSNAILSGFIYKVRNANTGAAMGWWPCDTTFSELYTGSDVPKTLMEYSLLTYNRAVGIRENTKEAQNVSVFPNPSHHNQTIMIESDKESTCTVELYDLMGRFIKTVSKGTVSIGKTSIMHDVSSLSNSMYIYIIKLDGKVLNKKFIKE